MVKAPFPKGKDARGYYNLMGRDGELHGHLKLDNVAGIALVSKILPAVSLKIRVAATGCSHGCGIDVPRPCLASSRHCFTSSSAAA